MYFERKDDDNLSQRLFDCVMEWFRRETDDWGHIPDPEEFFGRWGLNAPEDLMQKYALQKKRIYALQKKRMEVQEDVRKETKRKMEELRIKKPEEYRKICTTSVFVGAVTTDE